MSFSYNTYTAPSGAFAVSTSFATGECVAGSFAPIYNPSILNKYQNSYGVEKVYELGSDAWVKAIKKYSTPIQTNDFDLYGQRLKELTMHLQQNPAHCSLSPLRGAAKPCVTAEVMSRGTIQYDYFNFQNNSNRPLQPTIIRDLTSILKLRDPGLEIYNINVTDTSKGGQGINNLVDFLFHIKSTNNEFANQKWILDLNLFHDNTQNTDIRNIKNVLKKQKCGFTITSTQYEVSHLIVEDFDPALAVTLEWDGKRHAFKPCSVPGQFLYQTGNEVRLIEMDNSYLAMEEIFSKAITENMTTANDLTQIGVVWNEYQVK